MPRSPARFTQADVARALLVAGEAAMSLGVSEKTLEGFKSRWRRTRAKAGVTARFHDTRHTFATRVLRGSGNFRAVQQLLRHSDPKTTAKYAHVLADDLRDAMQSARVKSGAEIPETITEISEPVLKKPLRQKDNLK